MFATLLTLPVVLLHSGADGLISCKNQDGQDVDWYAGYKLPELDGDDPGYDGLGFLYADSSSSHWSKPQKINTQRCAVAATLSQYYKAKDDKTTFYILYNDEVPKAKQDFRNKGHAKGVAVFDKNSGFWLIHSVPKFPPTKTYSYAPNGRRFGQSFLCVTMDGKSLKTVARQLTYIQPAVYQIQIPPALARMYPELELLKTERLKLNDTSSVLPIVSKGGTKFTSFAKNKYYGKDIYLDLILPEEKSSLLAETWLNGGGDLPSTCDKPYQVKNIKELKMEGKQFLNSNDHSKWAVGASPSKPIVCIGDINRQKSQAKRGGGSMCFSNRKLWNLYDSAVVSLEDCTVTK